MLIKQMETYIKSCTKTLDAMFNMQSISGQGDYSIELAEQFKPSNDTCVHIPFFGNISGEFFFSVNMSDWKYSVKKVIGMDDDELVFSCLKEFLNTVAGETINVISKDFPNLTYLSPRITMGKMEYPAVKSVSAKLKMETLTTFELGISIDLMKIDMNEKAESGKSEAISKNKENRNNERMTVLGSLVENVLQDLRNPVMNLDEGLNEIKNLALTNTPPLPEKLNSLLDSVTRIKNIAGTLVNFTNATSYTTSKFNLIECANKAVKMSKYSYPSNVQIVIKTPEKPLPEINSNPRQVEQVIFNLIVNSLEALENTHDPEIVIESFCEVSYCGYHISHNGEKESNENKVWEPIFSRNKSGNITSLGLAVCREILQMYDGDIFLNNETEERTTFTVILPVQ